MEGAVWLVVLVQGDNILYITADWKMAKNGTCQNGNQPRLDLYYLGHSMLPAFSFIPQLAAEVCVPSSRESDRPFRIAS